MDRCMYKRISRIGLAILLAGLCSTAQAQRTAGKEKKLYLLPPVVYEETYLPDETKKPAEVLPGILIPCRMRSSTVLIIDGVTLPTGKNTPVYTAKSGSILNGCFHATSPTTTYIVDGVILAPPCDGMALQRKIDRIPALSSTEYLQTGGVPAGRTHPAYTHNQLTDHYTACVADPENVTLWQEWSTLQYRLCKSR